MDIGEGLCFGEGCERCKPDDSQTCTPWAKNKNKIKKKKNPFHISDRTRDIRNSSDEILSFYLGDNGMHKNFYSHVICHGGLFIHLSNG